MGKNKGKNKNKNKNFVRPPEPLKPLDIKLWFMMPGKRIYDTRCEHGVQVSTALNGVLGHEKMSREMLTDLESWAYDKITPGVKSALGSKHLDQALNICLDEAAADPKITRTPELDARAKYLRECDVIDFTEYAKSHDVYAEAAKRINESASEADISYLWATNEYVRIKVGDGLEYEIRREEYDSKDNTILYEIRIYETYKLFAEKTMTVPSMIMHGRVAFQSLQAIENLLDMFDATYEAMRPQVPNIGGSAVDIFKVTLEKNRELVDAMKSDIVAKFAEESKDEDIEIDLSKIIMPIFVMDKGLYAAHISEYVRKYIESKPMPAKPDQLEPIVRDAATKSISNMLLGSYMDMPNEIGIIGENGEIVVGDAELSRKILLHTIQKASAPLAYIIITNGMIADKKASKPIRGTAKAKQPETKPSGTDENDGSEPKRADENTAEGKRKLRILDGTIPMSSSASRLLGPSMRRIANYTVSEWGRKGHLRHYKSGKTVEIKPVTVKRRKTNDGGAKPKAGTDYVIKPGKGGDEK